MKKILNKKILLPAILLFAAFLRLYRIDEYMTFLGDEGRDVLVVWHILHGDFTLLGPTASVGGFFLGPIYYYFMAPFLFVSNYHPVGPAVMIALIGIATVFLVYKTGTILFNNKWIGIIAAGLYAVSPVVIAYSRSSWNPNPMPFFSLLTLFFCYKSFETKKNYPLVISGFLLGISLQLHYLATFLGAVIFFYILLSFIFTKFPPKQKILYKSKEISKKYTLMFIGFLAGISPFLAFEVRHSFPNTQSIIKFIFTSGNVSGNSNFFQITSDVFFRLFGRLITAFPPPEQISNMEKTQVEIWHSLALLLAILSVVLFLFQFYKEVKSGKTLYKKLLILIWLVVVLCLFGFYKKPIYDYYLGLIFPLPFLLVGNLLVYFFKNGILYKFAGTIILTVLLIVNLQNLPFRFSPNRQYYQVRDISNLVLKQANGKPFNFALITGGNSDHGYRYIFETQGKHPVTILNTQDDPKRKSVTSQLFVVCETLPCHPLGHSLWEIAGFGRAEIAGEWNISVVKVYKLIHYREK